MTVVAEMMPIAKVIVSKRHRQDLGDIAALAESIRSVGLLHPIVVNPSRELIAGERRLAAMKVLELDMVPVTVVDNLNDALQSLIAERDENTQRKDFSPSEAVALAETLEPMERKAAKQRQGTRTDQHPGKLPEGSKGDTRDKLAAAVGMSGRTLEMATAVVEAAKADPDRFGAVAQEMDRTGKVSKAFAVVRREKKAEKVRKDAVLPSTKYRVIYADPPWRYNDIADDGAIQSGGQARHYPSMTIREICDLPIASMVEDDSVLFLWVTSPLLFDSATVIAAWGFTYKASFVWDKVKHNLGHYNSVRHEFLLVCTRGSCTPDVVRLFDSVQSVERTTHSTKPEIFRTIIDAIYPHGKRIELFARREAEGWDSYGNELSNDDVRA